MLPYTPITLQLLEKSYVMNEVEVVKDVKATNSFIIYLILAQGIVDPIAAYNRLTLAEISLESWGGTSKSEALFWLANMASTSEAVTE